MSLLTVDREKCKQCGECVAACPAILIEINDTKVFPTMVEGGE